MSIKIATSINFKSEDDLHEENVYENTSIYFGKEKSTQESTLICPNTYGPGLTIMQKQGYDGCSGLGNKKKE